MIYNLCLVYPYAELIPFPAPYEVDEAGPKPWNALLFVDKAISEEAAIVFYGKNTWRLSDSATQIANKSKNHEGPPQLWTSHLRSMRNITIALDGRAVKQSTIWKSGMKMFNGGGYSYSREQRHEEIHLELLRLLEEKWTKKLRWLSEIEDLKSLHVDLSNAYCPNAHCRPIKLVVELLYQYVPDQEELLKGAITVNGMVTAEEASHAHAAGYLCECCYDPEDEEEDGVRAEPYCMTGLPSKYD